MNAMTEYYYAKEREESAVERINDSYLEALNSLEKLEAENTKLRELVLTLAFCANDEADCDQCPMNGARCDAVQQCFCDGASEALREIGIEVNA